MIRHGTPYRPDAPTKPRVDGPQMAIVTGPAGEETVRQTNQASYVEGSLIKACYGNEAATGGDVQFGTQGAECEPKTWSKTVRIADKGVVGDGDEWWMNHKETWGKLTYVKDTQSYLTPDREEITSRVQLASLDGIDRDIPPAQHAFYEGPKLLPRLAPGMERFLGPRGSSSVPNVPPRLAPKPGPEPGPEPAPGPRGPGGFRVSGCRSERICFERKNYDETEYWRQLKI